MCIPCMGGHGRDAHGMPGYVRDADLIAVHDGDAYAAYMIVTHIVIHIPSTNRDAHPLVGYNSQETIRITWVHCT